MNGLIKFSLRCLLRLLYGVRVVGLEHYREAGNRVLIVSNHTSLLDGVLLYAWLPETPTFAINTHVAQQKKFIFFLKFVDLFIMDPTNPLSVKSMINFIKNDRKAVIFPEGRITTTGVLMKIYEGPGLIADKASAMILPISVDGTQLTPFSYMQGRGHITWFPRITIRVLPPETISLDPDLKGHARRMAAANAMQDLMFRLYYTTYDYNNDLYSALLDAANRYGMNREVVEDINREPLNYRQFITRTLILARLLRTDTEPGEHIGLLLPNVTTTLIAVMALQYLHRICAMLNYTAGAQAILRACDVGNVRTVYTSRRFIEQANLHTVAEELDNKINLIYLEDLRNKVTVIDKLAGFIRSYYTTRHYRKRSRQTGPDNPAIILFTSGSEGIPKGVILSHKNILSNFAQVRCHIHFGAADTVFACLPMFHSFGLNAGCLMPLLGGSKVFIYPTPLHYRLIPELIYELGISILFGTSTFFKGYARYAHAFDFQSLRYTVAGAEKLRDDTRKIWMEKFGIRILEGYGVTEASPVISVNTPLICRQGTVGQILPGMECYIKPVPGISEGGRLVVKGPNVMLGYLLHDKPGEIVSPATERGPDWYDTGDIAAIDADGFISIIGRAKRFAKLGGEMISLAAVEELAMETWPGFNHAAVNLPDEKKGEKIVLVTDNMNAGRKAIQERAKQLKYGELYIPRKVVLAEELPMLSTGKVDYIILTQMAMKEDEEGTGWISKLAHFMKKPEKAEIADEEDAEADVGKEDL